MATLVEYAILANAAYRDTRSARNRPVLPSDEWIRLDRTQFGLTSGPDAFSGFSAEILQNQETGEIVISYEGTNPDAFSADGLKDWLIGNAPTALGWAAKQNK